MSIFWQLQKDISAICDTKEYCQKDTGQDILCFGTGKIVKETGEKDMKEIEKFSRELGLKIAMVRKERGLTQAELAKRLNISRTHISNIEAFHMHTGISMELFLKICLELQIRPEDMMHLDAAGIFVE